MTWYALVFLPEDKILSKPEYLSRVTVSERNAAQAAQGITALRWKEVKSNLVESAMNITRCWQVC